MKKFIALKERADINGEIRYPEEGAIAVAVKDAERLISAGKAVAATEPGATDAPSTKTKAKRKAKPKSKATPKAAKPAPAPSPAAKPEPTPEPPSDVVVDTVTTGG